jgi:hypothetical protein
MYSADILISNLTEVGVVPVAKYADLWPDTLNAPDANNASEAPLTDGDTFRLLSPRSLEAQNKLKCTR